MNEELFDKYVETKDINVRNELIELNMPLVKYIVGKIYKYRKLDQDFEDLVHYGVFGLIKAIEKFDGRNVKFSTYAYPRIYGSIIDELRNIDWVPRTVRAKIKKFRKYAEGMEAVSGSGININKLAREQGLSPYEIEIMHGTHLVDYDKVAQFLENGGDDYATLLR